jgi:hypothetical protein
MTEKSGFPYFQIQFDKHGNIFDSSEVEALLEGIESNEITDLVVLSHGWKNDIADATALYEELISNLRKVLEAGSAGGLPNRKLGFVGVFWPSKKFTPVELQPGGGASIEGLITDDMIRDELDALAVLADADDASSKIDEAKALVAELEDRKSAQDKFVELVLEILADDRADTEVDEETPEALTHEPGREIIDRLSRPGLGDLGGGSGGEAGISDVFNGLKGGVMNFLNLTTYWKMKKRAGQVGENGLYSILKTLKDRHPDLAVHLVGHSFGGRLVAAAARGPDGQPAISVESMSLLQAAFSHNGFATDFDGDRDGYFVRVVTDHRVRGPILVTHTANDRAVGLAYPLASRISRDDSAGIGDENDRFGGIGRNGAQHSNALEQTLKDETESYSFSAGKLHNLLADDFVSNHSDVRGVAIANMIVCGIAAD